MRIWCFILIFICSCSPQKKLQRLIKKHPELLTQDTLNLIIHDTIIVVNNEKVYLKYFYDTLTREIFHEVTCYGDTIFYTKEIPVIVDKVVIKELSWWERWKDVIIIIGVLILFLILFKKFGKVLL